MQAVILAAGRGTRLGELGQARSKAMQPVVGAPIIGHILADLAALELHEIVVVRAPQDRELQDYLNSRPVEGLVIQQVLQPDPQGMAHALEIAAPLIDRDFLLIACDNRVPRLELQGMITSWRKRRDLDALLGLLEIPAEMVSQSGIVRLSGSRVEGIIEKPALAAAPSTTASIPFYCLRPDFLMLLESVRPSARGERELQQALQRLIDRPAQVEGWFFSQRQSLSRPDDLLRINLEALPRHLPALDVQSERIGPGVQFFPPLRVDAGVVIGAGSLIGPNVYLEAGSRVGRQAQLTNCLVLRGGSVPDGQQVHGTLIGQDISEQG